MKEKIKHQQALALYISMGRARSLVNLQRELGKSGIRVSETALANWSRAFRWQERTAEADAKAGVRAIQKAEDSLAEMNHRHVTIAKATQAAYARRLKAGEIEPTPADAARMIGIERAIRGKPIDQGDLTGDPVGDADADIIIQEQTQRIARFRARRGV